MLQENIRCRIFIYIEKSAYLLEVLRGQPIKFIQVVSSYSMNIDGIDVSKLIARISTVPQKPWQWTQTKCMIIIYYIPPLDLMKECSKSLSISFSMRKKFEEVWYPWILLEFLLLYFHELFLKFLFHVLKLGLRSSSLSTSMTK